MAWQPSDSNPTPTFKDEKKNVIGELERKIKYSSIQDDDLPLPPPPVFQTYGAKLRGGSEEDLPPPPSTYHLAPSIPPPPPPPLNPSGQAPITMPDYSKLSTRSQEEDKTFTPKLLPITPQGYQRNSQSPVGFSKVYAPSSSAGASSRTTPSPPPPPPPSSFSTPTPYSPPASSPVRATRTSPGPTRASPGPSRTSPSPTRASPTSLRVASSSSPSRTVFNCGSAPSPPVSPNKTRIVLGGGGGPSSQKAAQPVVAAVVNRPPSAVRSSPPSAIRSPPPSGARYSPPSSSTGSGAAGYTTLGLDSLPSNGYERKAERRYLSDDQDDEAAAAIADAASTALEQLEELESHAAPRASGGLCGQCEQPVERIGCVSAHGKVYHKGCFRCSDCGKELQGRYHTKDNAPLCDTCFQEGSETCFMCEKLIIGDSLKAGAKWFHPDCMKCAVCGKQLSGKFYTMGNKIVCEDDYKSTLESCSVCGEILSGAFYKMDGKNVCEKDYKSQLAQCDKCGGEVEGKIMKVSNKIFHPNCFNCSVCSKSLVGIPFSQDENKDMLCTEDYRKKYASKCDRCGDYILPKEGEASAERVKVMNKSFHPQCFRCEDCELVFNSREKGKECYPLDDSFLCMDCCVKRQNKSV